MRILRPRVTGDAARSPLISPEPAASLLAVLFSMPPMPMPIWEISSRSPPQYAERWEARLPVAGPPRSQTGARLIGRAARALMAVGSSQPMPLQMSRLPRASPAALWTQTRSRASTACDSLTARSADIRAAAEEALRNLPRCASLGTPPARAAADPDARTSAAPRSLSRPRRWCSPSSASSAASAPTCPAGTTRRCVGRQ